MTAPGQAQEPWNAHFWPCVLFYTNAWEPNGKPSAGRVCTCPKESPGQADEYTPTEDEVRENFIIGSCSDDPRDPSEEDARARFDRFLAGYFTPQAVAEIRQQVREAALLEAAQIAEAAIPHPWFKDHTYVRSGVEVAVAIRAAANQTGEEHGHQ